MEKKSHHLCYWQPGAIVPPGLRGKVTDTFWLLQDTYHLWERATRLSKGLLRSRPGDQPGKGKLLTFWNAMGYSHAPCADTMLLLSQPWLKPCGYTVETTWPGVKSPPWDGAADVNRQKVSSKAMCSSCVQEASPTPRPDHIWPDILVRGHGAATDPCPCPDMNWSNWKSTSTKLVHNWQTSHSTDTVSCQSTPALILHGKIPSALR